MTPYDIYREWASRVAYVAPEEKDILLFRTRTAIKKCEEIFDQGRNTEGAAEAVEILRKLRKFETGILMGQNPGGF